MTTLLSKIESLHYSKAQQYGWIILLFTRIVGHMVLHPGALLSAPGGESHAKTENLLLLTVPVSNIQTIMVMVLICAQLLSFPRGCQQPWGSVFNYSDHLPSDVGRMMPHITCFSPQPCPHFRDIHVLITGICEYVTLYGKQGFCKFDKTKMFEMGILFWIIGKAMY